MKKKICKECGKNKDERGFWHRRDGSVFDVCKECACKYIDNKKPSTFLWILKEADVPFIEERWIELCRKKYNKDPLRFGPSSVIGTYLRVMAITTFKNYRYSDTLELNQELIKYRKRMSEDKAKVEEQAKALEKDVKEISSIEDSIDSIQKSTYEIEGIPQTEQPEQSVISPSLNSYNVPVTSMQSKVSYSNQVPQTQEEQPNYHVIDVDEQVILDNLSPEDIQYLTMKWGGSFKPSEWIKMEEMYQKYCGEFEIGVDRETVLISMCKTSINMQRCLDSGDAANAQKFSSVFDQLRKSGAFTEAQKKEEKNHYLDSLGELVAVVEREGGVIPKFDYEFEVNPDKVDLTLKDMQSYTYNLVKNEMGLGDLIESYIQKLEAQMEEEKKKNLSEGLITSKAEEQQLQNDEYADDWLNNLEDSVAADADEFYAKIGNDEDDKYIEMIRANQEKNGE